MTFARRLRAAAMTGALALVAGAGASAQQPRLGVIDFPTSATGDAQREFVTGVLYLHSFEYEKAADAFRRSQALAPRFALAYWGEAMTYTHPVWNEQDTAAARAALRRLAPTRAARLALAPNARERGYLEAVEALYGDGSKPARDTAYSAAMELQAAAYPADREAQLFYALSLLGLNQGERDVPTYMRAGAIADEIFAANPQHPGAAHYVIHAFDDPVHAPLGLRAARAYSTIAPDAAHAQHMTTHIFLALGMWDETVHANEVATVAMRDTSAHRTRDACGHYGEWLQYGYLQQGRPSAASKLLDECRAQAAADGLWGRGSVALMRAVQIVETRSKDSAAIRLRVDTAGLYPFALDLIDYGTGYAAVARGDLATARSALQSMHGRAHVVREGFRGYAEIMERELLAMVQLSSGQRDVAVRTIRRGVAIEDSLPVDFGPPNDVKPPRELLGEMLTQIGQPDLAVPELEHQLARTPRRSLTLLALAQAAAAAGQTGKADAARRELARVWHGAEPSVASTLTAGSARE